MFPSQDKIDTTTAMGRFSFRMLASISELERDIISERTKDGLTVARARGRKGGRPKVVSKKIVLAMKMYESKGRIFLVPQFGQIMKQGMYC